MMTDAKKMQDVILIAKKKDEQNKMLGKRQFTQAFEQVETPLPPVQIVEKPV